MRRNPTASLWAAVTLTGTLLDFSALPAAEPAPDFTRAGHAFLQKHCLRCHNDKVKRADLSLEGYGDAVSVMKGRKVFQNVLKMVQSGEMPPPTRPRPGPAEVEAFAGVVNDVFAWAERNASPDPGRVTVRRLNRYEYSRTIRDLVGVDFDPAEDFPADDIGHGFDNIGDVLSMSPVLMERYLAAAEGIMQRAILVDPPKPPVRHLVARYTEPAGAGTPQTRFRPIDKRATIFTTYQLTMGGEFIFRFRGYAQKAGKDPIKIDYFVNDAKVGSAEVKGDGEKTATVHEVKLTLAKGRQRVGIRMDPPPEDTAGRTVQVEYLQLTGPLDTRPDSHRLLLACREGAPRAEQTREVLTRFVTRAYRRPATPEEVMRLEKLVASVEAGGGKWEAAIQLAMQAVLVSPKFLFRLELDDRPDSDKPHPITEFQLASRLSYFLWSSMPDDELFDLARKGRLTASLDAQVERMLKDPRAGALADSFFLQWLQLRRLETFAADTRLFPGFTPQLRKAMLDETRLFVEEVIREDRSILDLIDADFTYLNEPLARHYGIVDTNGNRAGKKPAGPRGQQIRGTDMLRVALTDDERGGILTQASVLTVTSNPTRTSPVKRGRWVLEQILGTPPPPPPPNVPELKEDEKAVLTGSLRQRMEQHRVNPACASCHERMDPLGFAFENYNAIGAFRLKDGEFPIDPSGTLPGGATFSGPSELKVILKEKKELFARCLAEKMLTYALGRGVEYYDRPTLERIVGALATKDYRFSALVKEIVKSDPFRLRRGKEKGQ